MNKKCNHLPKKGKPNRYISLHFLMCSLCKKAIRKLTWQDRERMVHARILPIPEKYRNLIKTK